MKTDNTYNATYCNYFLLTPILTLFPPNIVSVYIHMSLPIYPPLYCYVPVVPVGHWGPVGDSATLFPGAP